MIIESTYKLNQMFFDCIIPRIQQIFTEQLKDNRVFKVDEKKNLLRFKIYFLGTIDKMIHSFYINSKEDMKNVIF